MPVNMKKLIFQKLYFFAGTTNFAVRLKPAAVREDLIQTSWPSWNIYNSVRYCAVKENYHFIKEKDMPPVSMKKIFIAILIVLVLAKLDRIIEMCQHIYQFFYDWISPQSFHPTGKVAIATLILALLYISIYKILYDRMTKKWKEVTYVEIASSINMSF